MISTYTFSPRGREILTIGNKYFERELGQHEIESKSTEQNQTEEKESYQSVNSWKKGMLLDYFAGQEIEEEKKDGEKTKSEFPILGFDTHAISPKGVEMITKGNDLFYRNSTTSKIWKKMTLIDFFKDHLVINALPDAPEEQLPTIKLKTHAISPEEEEIITYKDRFWRRKGEVKDWQTGRLRDYFNEQKIQEGEFPLNYWDIHLFTPRGDEIIIVGDRLWIKNFENNIWQVKTLKEYFGEDFPLEKELEEKNKVEQELEKRRYEMIKEKVMGELIKFFRPELINRFDEVIIFEPLRFSHMMEIVRLQLKEVGKLLEDQEIGFLYTESAVKEIVHVGFDPIYGARPLRRAIQKLIENPISTMIIEGKVKSGDQVLVDFDGNNFVFNIERVELVETEKNIKGKVLNFLCEICANRFKTEVIDNATTICSRCASRQVQETVEEEKNHMNLNNFQTNSQSQEKTFELNQSQETVTNQINNAFQNQSISSFSTIS